jgi:two-component system, chemotaxis family, protein-glutamate methylesterase/glutaminase
MPSSAISGDHPNRILPLVEIAPAVVETLEGLSEKTPISHNGSYEMSLETSYSTLDRETVARSRPPGVPSGFSCPACGGVLWEVEDDDLLRFRCRVGHAYTAEGACDEQAEAVEDALWAAFRALHERAELTQRIARRSRAGGSERTSKRFDELGREALDQANLIRTVLLARDDGAD